MNQEKSESHTITISDQDHTRGPSDAPVTLVQYSDFECPSCRDLYPVIRRIHNRVATRLRLVFRHFPLTEQHEHAQHAAEAAEAAAAQDEKYFWKIHDLLYEHQDALTPNDLEEYAAELGLDVDKFIQDLAEGTFHDHVEEDLQSGHQSGVTGTPTFFINGKRYKGPLEFEPLLIAIADAGEFSDIKESMDLENQKQRETIDSSSKGAPAVGKAVRDRFSADEIFQRITAGAEEEIDRSARLLFFSGLAAGTSVSASFFGRALMTTAYPFDPTGLGNLLYPVGFIIIVLGGYQLFTENTLMPVTLVLTRLASIPSLLRLWGIVLFANVIGAGIIAFFFAKTTILEPAVAETGRNFGEHALSFPWSALFFKGILAGGLVATMVWLAHAARDTTSRFFIVYVIMFLIPAGDLFHCVVGAFEMFYLVFSGPTSLLTVFVDFFVPVVLGNTVGGVFFVTLVNYGMTAEREIPLRNFRPKLSLSEWLFGKYAAKFISKE